MLLTHTRTVAAMTWAARHPLISAAVAVALASLAVGSVGHPGLQLPIAFAGLWMTVEAFRGWDAATAHERMGAAAWFGLALIVALVLLLRWIELVASL